MALLRRRGNKALNGSINCVNVPNINLVNVPKYQNIPNVLLTFLALHVFPLVSLTWFYSCPGFSICNTGNEICVYVLF